MSGTGRSDPAAPEPSSPESRSEPEASAAAVPHDPEPPWLIAVHLSGARRGTTERRRGRRLFLGTAPDADFRLDLGEPGIAARHAELSWVEGRLEILAAPGCSLWLNGELIQSAVLQSNDLLSLGDAGPLLRLRTAPPAAAQHKTLTEAMRDCLDCARHASSSLPARTALFATLVPREIYSETSPRVRWGIAAVLAVFLLLTGLSWQRMSRLEEQLAAAQAQITGIPELLERSEAAALDRARLTSLQQELQRDVEATDSRLHSLEASSDSVRRAIAATAPSVVFIQGAYGFVSEEDGRPLRFSGLDPQGNPLRDEDGSPRVSVDGDGPEIESLYTGSGFVVSEDGLVLTNRHVALPWEEDPAARLIERQGYRPMIRRLVGFVPGVEKAFPVELVKTSEESDLAVLRCSAVTVGISALPLRTTPVTPGEELIVLGYPAGIRALLARAGEPFVERLISSDPDFWQIAGSLARDGLLAPLATRGIIGQVTEAAVVYDAETTGGGSGGPAIDLAGHVVAINTAILPEFGGSNLGVPAAAASRLLASLEATGTKQ